MKKVIIALALLAVTFNMKAEDKKEQSTKPVILNAGIGVSNWGLPIFLGVDFYLTEIISGGVMAGFSTKDFGAGKYTVMGGVLRGNYHYGQRLKGIPEKMDLYAGLNLGYYALSYKVNGNKVTGVGIDNGFLALAGQAGMRYKLSSKLSGLAEVGGGAGISGLRLGISYNIK